MADAEGETTRLIDQQVDIMEYGLNNPLIQATEDERDDQDGWPTPSREKGCMMCWQKETVTHFNQLQPGDHISMPGRPSVPLLGLLYSHHAIVQAVENVSDDGQTAKLTVIDVDNKGKLKSCIPCGRAPYQVNSHTLYDRDIHTLSRTALCLSTDEVYLEKIHYRKRKFSKEATIKRATECNRMKKDIAVKYCFFTQNCEHFVAMCVNGTNTLGQKYSTTSISTQTNRLFWLLDASSRWLFLLWAYGTIDFKDPLFIVTTLLMCVQTLTEFWSDKKQYNSGFICGLCVITLVSTFWFRIILSLIILLINYATNFRVRKAVLELSTIGFIAVFLLVSVVSAILVYSLSSLLMKCIMWIVGRCNPRLRGYSDYFPYRGILCPFIKCNRKE